MFSMALYKFEIYLRYHISNNRTIMFRIIIVDPKHHNPVKSKIKQENKISENMSYKLSWIHLK